ncbi:MAG: hypothetical protein ACTSWH_13350 [Promethearchaeota archaeon]
MTTKISIVHIEDYKNLQEAIIKGIELIEDDFKFNLHELSNILLKPNLLRIYILFMLFRSMPPSSY